MWIRDWEFKDLSGAFQIFQTIYFHVITTFFGWCRLKSHFCRRVYQSPAARLGFTQRDLKISILDRQTYRQIHISLVTANYTLRRANRRVVPVHLIEIHKYGSKGTGQGHPKKSGRLLESILKKVRLVLLISNLAKMQHSKQKGDEVLVGENSNAKRCKTPRDPLPLSRLRLGVSPRVQLVELWNASSC